MATNPYKFVVNSTIIQNTPAGEPGKSKRGMNSSVGAFWNSTKDGMWSYKYDAGATLGMDVVLSVIWVALDKQP
jgi:dynein light chain Tctex-type 1